MHENWECITRWSKYIRWFPSNVVMTFKGINCIADNEKIRKKTAICRVYCRRIYIEIFSSLYSTLEMWSLFFAVCVKLCTVFLDAKVLWKQINRFIFDYIIEGVISIRFTPAFSFTHLLKLMFRQTKKTRLTWWVLNITIRESIIMVKKLVSGN